MSLIQTIPRKEPVYLVIPVYNRKETTLAGLANLQANGDLDRYHIIVVDDASTDGTKEAIHTLHPEVEVLAGNGDLWWTGAIAQGMNYADQRGGDYIIWLNDDCLPAPGTLPTLIDFLKQHPNTIAAPTCGTQQGDRFVKKPNGSKGQTPLAANPGEVINVNSLAGWCVAFPTSIIRQIGLPNAAKFPHYCGDDMYVLKAVRSGYKAYLMGDVTATLVGPVHEMSSFQTYFRPGLSARQTFQALFWHKKSPYRLATKFFYMIERYSVFVGAVFFLLKSALWVGKWLYYQFMLRFRAERFRVEERI